MVYAVPLSDSTYGIAQANAIQSSFINIVYVAIFSDRFIEIPKASPVLTRESAICLRATWEQGLNRKEWKSIGIAPEAFDKSELPNERYRHDAYVGTENSDVALLTKHLEAYHGLAPWNVMFDPKYFDQLLRPGIHRPESEILLDDKERETYRREVLNINI
ncbi:hypothetical protein ACRN9V_02190 [Shewanella baltica]|uniref:hypothetical protein n=1 Tax=Shewanella baltica TaxID=62322 RepID=UPI003D7937C3